MLRRLIAWLRSLFRRPAPALVAEVAATTEPPPPDNRQQRRAALRQEKWANRYADYLPLSRRQRRFNWRTACRDAWIDQTWTPDELAAWAEEVEDLRQSVPWKPIPQRE